MAHITSPKACGIPIRSVIWLMIFTCTFALYLLRTNISIIILAMTKHDISTRNSSNANSECETKLTNPDINKTDYIMKQNNIHIQSVVYEWNASLQGFILGAYFWGFVISNIPGAVIAEKVGPRKTVAFSFAISTLMTLLGPLSAAIHPYALIASRFLIGLSGGVVYPAVHCLISKWAPPAEKGKFISATLGSSLGTVITWPLLGNIIVHASWDWAFYASGIIVLLWTILWTIVVYDSPEEHPWIQTDERDHITSSLAGTISTVKHIPPYKSIFTSRPVWALCIAQFGSLWGLFFLMTAGPTFMSTVLGFDLGHTGFLAALPYLARMLAGFVFGSLGDLIVRRQMMSKNTMRKSFIFFSHILPGLFLYLQTFARCQITYIIVFITLSLASNGSSTITNLSNAQDLAPNFAGSIYGIANTIGGTTGFLSPMLVGYITAEHNGLQEWHKIFYIGALVYIGCGIIFVIFGSVDIQSWNNTGDEGSPSENTIPVGGNDNTAYDGSSEHKV